MRPLHHVVTRAPGVLRGAAVFAGTTVPVTALIEHLDQGGTIDGFLERHPDVEPDLVLAACALGLETLIRTAPLEPAVTQASLLPRFDESGAITNAEELAARQVIGQRVRCPACRSLTFRSWPDGWDSHAATRCRGLVGDDPTARKAEFKRRFGQLFL